MLMFSERLLQWFDGHGRHDLPWQHPRTPYQVWVSEIMLQQTQVTTVVPFFERFMARFPDLAALAAAPLDEVLHHWSGLGYYARARNLRRTAIILQREHHGEFPRNLEALIALPGIGRSTAAAILALSFELRHPILDGNVKRLLTRLGAISGWPETRTVQKTLWALADALMPQTRVADYTQAIMDLGATLCTRSRPRCAECPVQSSCAAFADNAVERFPNRRPPRQLPTRETTFLVLEDQAGAVLLERRPPQGIWGGLWSFPELGDQEDARSWCAGQGFVADGDARSLPRIEHTFTHFRLMITPQLTRVARRGLRSMDSDRWLWYNSATPAHVGLAKPVAMIIKALHTNRTGV
ncbi:MAG: A/G-specific adenine glycosylase [Gammaproteobacteria bacterium]|nr:A/G-specific adenine glycosylase [Gammaproteobacteria bacterium]